MTVPIKIDPATLAAAAHVQALVDEAVRIERLRIAALEVELARHEKLFDACRRVAAATDALDQARFAGAAEIPARRTLERACARLGTLMRRGG